MHGNMVDVYYSGKWRKWAAIHLNWIAERIVVPPTWNLVTRLVLFKSETNLNERCGRVNPESLSWGRNHNHNRICKPFFAAFSIALLHRIVMRTCKMCKFNGSTSSHFVHNLLHSTEEMEKRRKKQPVLIAFRMTPRFFNTRGVKKRDGIHLIFRISFGDCAACDCVILWYRRRVYDVRAFSLSNALSHLFGQHTEKSFDSFLPPVNKSTNKTSVDTNTGRFIVTKQICIVRTIITKPNHTVMFILYFI